MRWTRFHDDDKAVEFNALRDKWCVYVSWYSQEDLDAIRQTHSKVHGTAQIYEIKQIIDLFVNLLQGLW